MDKSKELQSRTVPRGKALRWSEDDVDAMVSLDALEREVEAAAQDWREKAPRPFQGLLDATSVLDATSE